MKRMKLIVALMALCLPVWVSAQGGKKEATNDTPYLAGAVPQNEEGKVVFTKQLNVPGMEAHEIFDRAQKWLQERMARNQNNSRVVFSNEDKGQIVGMGNEWLVFSSSFLSLDRADLIYQIKLDVEPQKCIMEVSKIRYNYRDGEEKYTAEEWITDKYALNKSQTKLVRGLAKWRRKTVDFVNDLTKELSQSLSIAPVMEAARQEQPVQEQAAVVQVQQQPATQSQPVMEPLKVSPAKKPRNVMTQTAGTAPQTMTEIAPDQLPADVLQNGNGQWVIVIGQAPFNMTMMTANAGGSLGKVEGKPVVFTILSPEQDANAVEKADTYEVRFYRNDSQVPAAVLHCKKHPAPAAVPGMPRTFAGEIVKAQMQQ